MSVAEASPTTVGKKAKTGNPGHLTHHDHRVATQMARESASLERFQVLMKLIYGLIGMLFIAFGAVVYFGIQEPQVRYFTVDPNGNINEVLALERPIQSSEELLNWATTSITRAFTMSFSNYRQQMAESRLTFTTEGWEGFQRALKQTGVIDTIIENKLVSSVVPEGAPVVVSQGVAGTGAYAWRIEVPLIVTYESASGRQSTRFMVEAIIMRRAESEHPSGLGIDKIIAR